MLDEGYTLQEINNSCNIWYHIPDYLQNVNKDNCFTISWWQCCDKPAYQIIRIEMDGRVKVWGCGSWNGYYGNAVRIDDNDLRNVHSKGELYVIR